MRRTQADKIALLCEALRPFARAYEELPEDKQRRLCDPLRDGRAELPLRIAHLRDAWMAVQVTKEAPGAK